jgi:hypothetical protein
MEVALVQVSDCAANGDTKDPRREINNRRGNRRWDMAGSEVCESEEEEADECRPVSGAGSL